MAQFARNENPPPFDNYQEYRPFLRRDFRRLCAYCERTEAILGGEEFFEIDHFRPVDRFLDLVTHYPNLYYSCGKCNRHKGRTWPSVVSIERGFRFADPCQEDMYADHLEELARGELRYKTNCGAYTRDHIRLNRPDLLKWRQDRRQALNQVNVLEEMTAKLRSTAERTSGAIEREERLREVDALEAQILRLRQQYG